MPSRYVREGINSSRKVAGLAGDGERFYRRMLNVVDDFGRFELDAKLIRSAAFPVHDSIREADILQWLAACQKLELILVYKSGEKSYLVTPKVEKARAIFSKYPNPPPDLVKRYHLQTSADRCGQLHADVNGHTQTRTNAPLTVPIPVPKRKLNGAGAPKVFNGRLNPKQLEVAVRFEKALGPQWANDSLKWYGAIKRDVGLSERVVAEVESAAKEGRIKTSPAQFAEYTFQDFGGKHEK